MTTEELIAVYLKELSDTTMSKAAFDDLTARVRVLQTLLKK